MALPKISFFTQGLTRSQKISLISLIFLLLVIPLSLTVVFMPTRFFKRAAPIPQPISPPITPGPFLSCNFNDKGIITLENYTREDGYPGIRVTVTSNTLYQNTALVLTQKGLADGVFVGDLPTFTHNPSAQCNSYAWQWNTIRPVLEKYKIEFYINHTPHQNGEPCGEYRTYLCPGLDRGNLDCDPTGSINETDLNIILQNWANRLP